jgi:hypothetical protein
MIGAPERHQPGRCRVSCGYAAAHLARRRHRASGGGLGSSVAGTCLTIPTHRAAIAPLVYRRLDWSSSRHRKALARNSEGRSVLGHAARHVLTPSAHRGRGERRAQLVQA